MESEITIKGVTASLGQVDGEIFIVKSFEDLVKFKEGAILVSITTDPSYTLIMARLKGKEYWPFSPIQILSYYESEVIKHFYKRFYELKDKGYSDKQIADLFENTDMIIDFLFNFACVSFKVAHEFTDFKTEIYEREKFFNDFFKIIKLKDL